MRLSLWSSIFRKKTFDDDGLLKSNLKRCLNVFDVSSLAIGQMIGAGIYVFTGEVVRDKAGPSIVFSFLLAGFAAFLSALSYAEFGARYPRAGSAYTYAYVGVGELWAFIVGWTIILEYMIGNAAVARSLSAAFDHLFHDVIKNTTMSIIGPDTLPKGGYFAEYPDFLALLFLIIVTLAVAAGSKASTNVNKAFVCVNVGILIFVICYAFTYFNLDNWFGIDPAGNSMFFPYGVAGTLNGAAKCFFSFIGFEALATAGEEAKNPGRTIPISTMISLLVVTVLYTAVGAALTLMVPYYEVDKTVPFAAAFEGKGATVAMVVISIGSLAGMSNSLLTGAFALPRASYAMADDGLLFKFMAKVNKLTQIPLNALVVLTVINAVMILVFDLDALIEFLSIGTLLAYSIVSMCVLIMRYQPAAHTITSDKFDNGGNLRSWMPFRAFFKSLQPGRSVKAAIAGYIFGACLLAIAIDEQELIIYQSLAAWHVLIVVAVVIVFVSFILLLAHEENTSEIAFKVPLVPFVPCLSLAINMFMVMSLEGSTWIRMLIWTTIGMVIYILYGWNHSVEGIKQSKTHDLPVNMNAVQPVDNVAIA